MSDRIRHLTITLDRDYRDDDVRQIVDAIGMIKGVDSIEQTVVEITQLLARSAVESEVRIHLHDAIEAVFSKGRKP